MADVSVIIPCYNMRQYVAATIESVLGQTEPVRDIVVIDDGSTDDSAAAIEPFVRQTNGQVQLIRQHNAGESRARNLGIARACGQFVAFLDADDIWMPGKIARQLELLREHPDAAGVHTRIFNFEDYPGDRGREETELSKDDPQVAELVDHHWICPSTLMVRRSLLEQHDLRFDEAVRHSEDMLFIADLRLHGSLRLVDDLLVAKRVHAKQQSRSAWHTIYSTESRINWCRARAAVLPGELAHRLEQQLAGKLVRHLEDRYWRRQITGLSAMRKHVAELCPNAMAQSPLANRRLWPSWLYRMRDAVKRQR